MTENQQQDNARDNDPAQQPAPARDHVSDPALATSPGHDWTDEGGATSTGPAISKDPANATEGND
jgi:hypothetical protein